MFKIHTHTQSVSGWSSEGFGLVVGLSVSITARLAGSQ